MESERKEPGSSDQWSRLPRTHGPRGLQAAVCWRLGAGSLMLSFCLPTPHIQAGMEGDLRVWEEHAACGGSPVQCIRVICCETDTE